MAKQSLATMSVDALLKLRNDIGVVLSRKAKELENELKSITADYADGGRIAAHGKNSLAGRKIPAKYRGPNGELWAGRGAQPVWMTEAIRNGAKRDDFLIYKPAKGEKKRTMKRFRGKK